jgi:hypothetical protein
MIQPKLFAQLGNQCFMIACSIAHALKMGTTYSIPKKTISPNIWRTYFSHLPETKSATLHYYKEKRHCYDPLPEVDSLTIEGYFQSEQYFRVYKKEIADALGFVYAPTDYVAVHIRRGDYLKYPDQFPVMPLEYYQKGIDHFAEIGECRFKIYSDDIEWCKQNFKPEWWGAYVEYSANKDPLTDMKDMYNAAGFIIANSTFSLFPALLRSDNPIVIAPADDRWFGSKAKHIETCDLMPERFIKM